MERARGPLHSALKADPLAKERAKSLRAEMTMPERVLWNRLKQLRDRGLVFRRQHALGPYVADFYCHAAALVVEVDGLYPHLASGGRDRQRDAWMRERGLEVVRIGAWRLPREAPEIVDGLLRLAQGRIERLRGPAPLPPAPGGGDVTSAASDRGGMHPASPTP